MSPCIVQSRDPAKVVDTGSLVEDSVRLSFDRVQEVV